MRLGNEDRKKLIAAGVLGFFALFACWYLGSFFFGGSSPAPQPQPVVINRTPAAPSSAPGVSGSGSRGNAAPKVATVNGQLDPSLHEDAMHATESLLYSGTGRNIFAAGPGEAPVKPPPPPPTKADYSARTTQPPTPPVNQGPPPPPPTCPPMCPAIALKFFGTSTSASGVRRAFLLQGEDVFLATVGDVVARRYRVVSISPNSIQVEDIPNTNKQNLPLLK